MSAFVTQKRNIPIALSIVSYLFLLSGIVAFVGILGESARGSFRFDFNVLGLWMFFGLRRCSLGWRTCALFFIWLNIIVLAFAFIYGFFGSGPAFIEVFGKRYADIPVIWVSVVAIVFLPLALWMYRVLTRPSIRALFYGDLQPGNYRAS